VSAAPQDRRLVAASTPHEAACSVGTNRGSPHDLRTDELPRTRTAALASKRQRRRSRSRRLLVVVSGSELRAGRDFRIQDESGGGAVSCGRDDPGIRARPLSVARRGAPSGRRGRSSRALRRSFRGCSPARVVRRRLAIAGRLRCRWKAGEWRSVRPAPSRVARASAVRRRRGGERCPRVRRTALLSSGAGGALTPGRAPGARGARRSSSPRAASRGRSSGRPVGSNGCQNAWAAGSTR
jgi:hypothetical protein